ncbi:MAG: thioredoxin [Actinomycetota bacterium]
MELTHATDSTFDSEVLDSDRPVLVDFWADWCQPCKMVEPHLKAIAEEMPDKIRVVKVNLDDSPGVAGRFGVLSIPTMVLFNDGVEKTRLVGARPKEAIVSEIEQYL